MASNVKPFFSRTETVTVEPEHAGRLFANADANVQACFLLGMSYAIEEWKHSAGAWAIQCRAIEDRMGARRREVASVLETLLEHLQEEPPRARPCTDCRGTGRIQKKSTAGVTFENDCASCSGVGTITEPNY